MHVRTGDDRGIDEIIVFTQESGQLLRLAVSPRYKTSYMSGDVWRTSASWFRWHGGEWLPFERGYHDASTACIAIFGEVVDSHPDLLAHSDIYVHFYAKGVQVYEVRYPAAQPLLNALGRMAWQHILAGEQGRFVPLKNFCAQYGCSAVPTHTYKLKTRYRNGVPVDGDSLNLRSFCDKHKRRGNADLEDNDANYEPYES